MRGYMHSLLHSKPQNYIIYEAFIEYKFIAIHFFFPFLLKIFLIADNDNQIMSKFMNVILVVNYFYWNYNNIHLFIVISIITWCFPSVGYLCMNATRKRCNVVVDFKYENDWHQSHFVGNEQVLTHRWNQLHVERPRHIKIHKWPTKGKLRFFFAHSCFQFWLPMSNIPWCRSN